MEDLTKDWINYSYCDLPGEWWEGIGRTCCGGPIVCCGVTTGWLCWMPGPGGGCILDKASRGVYDLEEVGRDSLLVWNSKYTWLLIERYIENIKK